MRKKEAKRPNLYHTHRGMISRCTNPNSSNYMYYGGRGIKVCDRWLGKGGFSNFLIDMGEKPTTEHTLDRIDLNGDYEPSNCKWSTKHEQMANRSNSKETVGVHSFSGSHGFLAHFNVNKTTYRKVFKTEQEAIDYRKELEKKHLLITAV